MTASQTPAPVMVQTNTYNMTPNANQNQCGLCLKRFCLIWLTIISCVAILIGVALIPTALSPIPHISFSFDSTPEPPKPRTATLYAGIGLVISGIILLIICIILCCKMKRNNSSQVMYSGTAMTTVVTPPNIGSPGVIQPPQVQGTGGLPIYNYSQQPAHHGSSRHVQPTSNRYSPVPSGNEFLPVSRAQPSAPEQPPPSYNELMHQDKKITIV